MSTKRRREEDDSGQLRYVQITPKTARILLKILDLESEGATITRVAEALGEKPTPVREFIKEAERDTRQFLIFNEWSSTKGRQKPAAAKGKNTAAAKRRAGGRHTDILEIRPDKLITNPLSARILLLLAEMSKESREVSEAAFMNNLLEELDYLKAKYPDLEKELRARINFLIKIGDICNGDNTVPDIIWISWLRFHSQKAYLELLVEKLPAAPQASATTAELEGAPSPPPSAEGRQAGRAASLAASRRRPRPAGK